MTTQTIQRNAHILQIRQELTLQPDKKGGFITKRDSISEYQIRFTLTNNISKYQYVSVISFIMVCCFQTSKGLFAVCLFSNVKVNEFEFMNACERPHHSFVVLSLPDNEPFGHNNGIFHVYFLQRIEIYCSTNAASLVNTA